MNASTANVVAEMSWDRNKDETRALFNLLGDTIVQSHTFLVNMCLPYDHIPTPSVDANESDIWFESVSVAIWIVSRLPVQKHLWSLVGISHEVKPLIGQFHKSSKQCSRLQDYLVHGGV